jgi:hypothetical protein
MGWGRECGCLPSPEELPSIGEPPLPAKITFQPEPLVMEVLARDALKRLRPASLLVPRRAAGGQGGFWHCHSGHHGDSCSGPFITHSSRPETLHRR